nr:MAG TPA: DnaJ-like protein [Caudoviricetes sp.]
MTALNKQAYRADGGDIGTGRLKEIADNSYGDEEKRWLAQRVLVLLDELECRKAGKFPITQDGYVMVQKKLTAENGAKGVLSGEFSETKFINCPECFGEDECETCDGSGRLEITVPVTWTTIKAIWAKGVEHFEAATQQENV